MNPFDIVVSVVFQSAFYLGETSQSLISNTSLEQKQNYSMTGVKEWKPLILVLSHMPLQLNVVAEHAWSIYHSNAKLTFASTQM